MDQDKQEITFGRLDGYRRALRASMEIMERATLQLRQMRA